MPRLEDEIEIEENKENYLTIVLDASGSMRPLKDDVKGGFDSFVEEQKKAADEKGWTTYLTLITFGQMANDTRPTVIIDKKNINNVKPLNDDQYTCYGGTPLLDGIGFAINYTKDQIKDKEVGAVLFMTFTDGEENQSREFNNESVADLIKECEAKGYGFVYLGANQDSWASAQKFGTTSVGSTMNYVAADIAPTMRKAAMASTRYMTRSLTGDKSTENFFDESPKVSLAKDINNAVNNNVKNKKKVLNII